MTDRRMTAAERAKLSAELASVQRAYRTITGFVWAVAVGVMFFGLGVVTELLLTHNFPAEVAWLLSPVVDIGLVVGLFGTQLLARYGIPASWVGALRWVSAILTWGLNTASSWTADNGPDWIGVGIHSVAPLVLFFVAEAAAYLQSRMSTVVEKLRRRMEEADHDERAEKAQRAALEERARRAEAEALNAQSEARRLADEVAALTASRDEERAAHMQEVAALRSELDSVREALSTAAETALEAANRQHAQTLAELAEKHAAELARVRAESATVSLARYRETHSGKRARQQSDSASRRVVLSDAEAAEKCLEVHPEPDYPWSYRTVAEAARVSQKRARDIIALIEKHHANSAAGRGGERSRSRADGAADDPQEDSHDHLAVG